MKRSIALIAAGGMTTLLAVFTLIAVMSTMATPTTANQLPQAPVQNPVVASPSDVVAPQPTANTTAYEAALKEREQALQSQVAQLQQTLTELDTTSQAQVGQLEQQILGMQNQLGPVLANAETLQANAAAYQQAIQADGATYQAEMDKLTTAETQMRQQIEALNGQLIAAFNEVTQRQAMAAAAAASFSSSGGGGGGGGNSSSNSNGGSDDHDDHDDDHDDDHEDGDDD